MSSELIKKSTSLLLSEILDIKRVCSVVDIGANPIDGQPPYKTLLDEQLCTVTGFEPQKEALQKLNQSKSALETYLPYAIGDGQRHELKICQASGMTSIFEPDLTTLKTFGLFETFGKVIAREQVQTHRLDDIQEVRLLDYLKIDIQGGELSVFKHAQNKLANCAVIHTEISFIPLYQGQPTFSEVDQFLRHLGFIPHCFDAIRKWIISPMIVNNEPRRPLNQLLEADVVYCRNFLEPSSVGDDQLKYLGLVAHVCYASFDLTLKCINILESRGSIPEGASQRYLSSFKKS